MNSKEEYTETELEEVLLSHIEGSLDEKQRARLELSAIEDDEVFDRLAALEAELVDRYSRGELEAAQSARLAPLLASSRRLQSMSETSVALASSVERASTINSSKRTNPENRQALVSRKWGKQGAWVAALMLLALLLLSFLAGSRLRSQQHQTALEEEIRGHESQMEELETELERLRAINRELALELSRRGAERTRP